MSYKGKYKPKNTEKYLGDPTKITYRSLWERKFMVFCDTNKSIIKWGSEEVVVPYRSPKDKKMHRYFVDFIIEMEKKNGSKEVSLIEIKPKKQCLEPKRGKKQKRRFLGEVMTYGVNQAKWVAATEFAENRGWTFRVLTEDDLFKKGKNG